MSGLGILNVAQLLGASQVLIDSYGQKTAGYVQLLSLQTASPIPYEIPVAWAIPPMSEGEVVSQDLRHVFDGLTDGRVGELVLMARGSSLTETPGESPTHFVRYNPQNREAGFKAFESRIHEVRETGPGMGVLATIMVGGFTAFRDGTHAAGWDNVSFVADTHHPMARRDMHITAVSGLGTRAVLAGRDAVFITADRKHGLINSFVNKTQEAFLRPFVGSRPCLDRRDYRQKQADYFDLERNGIASRDLEPEFFEWFRCNPLTGDRRADIMRVFYGQLVSRASEVSLAKMNERHAIPGFQPQEVDVGVNPFREGTPLMNLIGILQFFAEEAGSVQIEGAFASSSASVPLIYQLQETPESVVSLLPLGVVQRHLHSNQVIGVVDFTGPLLWARSTTVAVLKDLDRRFAGTGYILLTPGHKGELMGATPHCRIRLATDRLNIGSHAATLARLKMRESPEAGYLLAQNVRMTNAGRDSISGRRADEDHGGVYLFHQAHLESNGSEMAVEIL